MERIRVVREDITQLDVDAVVNAANSTLLGGGGVDGAIHRAAGPELLQECRTLGGCPVGQARITGGYNLKASYVIHTVGPIWRGGVNREDQLLRNAYINSLILASEYKLKRIAFPNISTGVYGFPKQSAAMIAIRAVRNYLEHHNMPQEVIFACFDRENYAIYTRMLSQQTG